MATRVTALVGLFNDLTGTPEANQTMQVALLVPGGGPAINTTDNSFADATSKTVTLDGSGNLAINVEPPGDLTPIGCRYQLTTPSGNVIVSPVFAYSASPIDVSTWVIAPSYAGTLKMRAPVSDFTSAFETGKIVQYAISGQATMVATSQLIDASNTVQSVIDLNGDAALYFYPNSGLDNPLRYYIAQLPDGSLYYFSCPDTPTGYQGSWSGATNYFKHADTLASPADVVLRSGVLYQAVNDSLNSAPPSVDWKVWPGERITWHKVLGAPSTGGVIADQTAIAADGAVQTGSYAGSGGTLQDELRRLAQWPVTHVTAATYTSLDTDRIIEGDGTANAVAVTLRTAVGWTGLLILKAINVAHAVTFAGAGGQTFDGAATLTPALNVAYILYADAGNWRVAATANSGGGGASPLTTKGDLFTHGTSDTRLPVGTDNGTLAPDASQASGLVWRPPTVAVAYNYWFGAGGHYRIGIGYGSDGRHFSRTHEPIIDVGTGWESTWVKEPCLVIPPGSGAIWLYYAGYSDLGVTGRIGLATSADGGATWAKYASNPVLSPSQAWENNGSNSVQFGAVLYDVAETNAARRWKLWYGGGQQGVGGIGYAYSADGLAWTKYASNPVLAPTGTGWEQQRILPGAVVRLGDTYYLFYNGLKSGVNQPWQAGLATCTDPQGPYTKSAGNPLLVGDGIGGVLSANVTIGDTTIHVPDSSIYPIGGAVWIYDDPSYTVYYGTHVLARPSATTILVADAAPVAVSSTNGHVQSASFQSTFIRSAWYDGGWQFGLTAFNPDPAQSVPELSMLAYADAALGAIHLDQATGLIIRPLAAETTGANASWENPSIVSLVDAPRRYLAKPVATALAGLADVAITAPADGDLVRYSAAAGKWINHQPTIYGPLADSGGLLIRDSAGTPILAAR